MRSASLTLAAVLTLTSAVVLAQVPGRNVNMVAGTKYPDGDPYLQRQDEPTVAASTRNPLHLVGGSNDYRSVDMPGLPDGDVTGDAWLGLFKSRDGGQRWTSTLVPGYPQDQSPAGLLSPLKAYRVAADPVVRAGTSGLFYYAGLAFNRGTDAGSAVFMARLIDNNNREATDPVQYVDTSIVARALPGSGRFFDKPWLSVDIPRLGAATCAISTTIRGHVVTEHVLAGTAYVAFSSITGQDATLRSQIMLSMSRDCGATWSAPVALSSPNEIAQGSTIAIDPATGTVYVAWRRFSIPGGADADAIMVARSQMKGRQFLPPTIARKLQRGKRDYNVEDIFEHRGVSREREVVPLAEFDQSSSANTLRFRTNAYPSMTWDDRGRAYLAWSERGFSQVPTQEDPTIGDAKIVISTATYGGAWTPPRAIDAAAPGHQLMPTLTFAGGKLLAVYYDLRDDVSQQLSPYIQDRPTPIGPDGHGKRHTMDIRAALGTRGPSPQFAASVKVSEYRMGTPPHETGQPRQLQFNPPNLPMFKAGTTPFMGDYIDVTPAPMFVPVPNTPWWTYNTAASAVPNFHAVWTDNRDVRPPLNGDWTKYTPPAVNDLQGSAGTFDPNDPANARPACVAGQAGSRNQNIYTSRISGGLVAGSPANAKPLSTAFERAFVVFAQNATNQTKTFRLTIVNQPAGGRASFVQWFPSQTPLPSPVTMLDVVTLPYSTAVRTVYATSTDPNARIQVNVDEIAAVGASALLAGGLDATILLNPDIENPDIENPDIENVDPANPDIENAEVMNPDIENLSLLNPDIENPDIENPDIENPDIENISVANPDIENPDIENPDIENPDIENPDIENPDIENAALTDVTWTVQNSGNTTSGYNVDLFLNQATLPSGLKVQLVLYKTYKTPVAAGCTLKTETRNVLVSNIPHPQLIPPGYQGLPDPNRPDGANATLWLAPGETGRITLRVIDSDPSNNVTLPNGATIDPFFLNGSSFIITPAIVPQAVATVNVANGDTLPTLVVDQSSLAFVQQPVSMPAGEAMSPAVAVLVHDSTGAPVPGAAVKVALAVGPAGAILLGTTTAVADAAGVAHFGDLRVSPVGSGYRLSASASFGPASLVALSTSFDVLPIVVTNTNDSGAGSLRQAMLDANANPGADAISFAIPGAGPTFTIAPQTPLPAITEAVSLDASTQPGVTTHPVVELDGENLPPESGPGLDVTGNGSTIRALAVNRFDIGIRLAGNGNTVLGSYVGSDPLGDVARPNGYGISVSGGNNVIGGTAALAMNVISGNSLDGIHISITADGTQVIGSHIGLNANGFKPLPNGGAGVFVGGTHTDINHSAISANAQQGVMIVNSANHLWANAIGSYPDGSLNGATNAGIGNKLEGVRIEQLPTDLPPPTDNNVVDNGNVIAGNEGDGIVVASGTGNTILSNSIFRNGAAIDGGIGIDLNGDGATPNDPGDADGGANNTQNYPYLTGAATNSTAGKTYISFQLDTAPGTYRLQFFSGASCGATTLIYENPVTVSGVYSDTIEVPAVSGTTIVATATDANGNTSEFSNCATVGTTNAFLWSGASGGNGHLYEYVVGAGTWTAARDAASGRSVNGMRGHLVTIGGAAENTFVNDLYRRMGLSDMRAWIGLYDPTGTFAWRWVNGNPTSYFNWNAGEPNNEGTEQYVEFFAAGVWNNISNTGDGFNQGYVVEYEFAPISF